MDGKGGKKKEKPKADFAPTTTPAVVTKTTNITTTKEESTKTGGVAAAGPTGTTALPKQKPAFGRTPSTPTTGADVQLREREKEKKYEEAADELMSRADKSLKSFSAFSFNSGASSLPAPRSTAYVDQLVASCI